jgi:hypothetical protein
LASLPCIMVNDFGHLQHRRNLCLTVNRCGHIEDVGYRPRLTAVAISISRLLDAARCFFHLWYIGSDPP